MKYIALSGEEFEGPRFHPQMHTVALLGEDGGIKYYATVYDESGKPLHRTELTADETGRLMYPEEDVAMKGEDKC